MSKPSNFLYISEKHEKQFITYLLGKGKKMEFSKRQPSRLVKRNIKKEAKDEFICFIHF